MVTTESGLQYKDIIVGQGPSPPVGFQVLTHIPCKTLRANVYALDHFLIAMYLRRLLQIVSPWCHLGRYSTGETVRDI
jgi:hypothetical protein